MTATPGIILNEVTLTYELHHERSRSLKEYVINFFHKRKYVDKRVTEFNALNKVNLTIFHGERVGIIGANGAGKSTLLKVIAGILKPSQGEIEVHGAIQPLIEIAAGFNPEFSGRENIYLNGYMLGFTKQQITAKEQEIVDFAELRDFIDTPVKYYSSGMSVRLAFAIATSIEPEYLLFDEMLAAGDAAFQAKAQARIQSLLDRAKIMILVSHDMGVVRQMTNRVLVIEGGQIAFDGPPDKAVDFYLSKL